MDEVGSSEWVAWGHTICCGGIGIWTQLVCSKHLYYGSLLCTTTIYISGVEQIKAASCILDSEKIKWNGSYLVKENSDKNLIWGEIEKFRFVSHSWRSVVLYVWSSQQQHSIIWGFATSANFQIQTQTWIRNLRSGPCRLIFTHFSGWFLYTFRFSNHWSS